jgi:hypothetical protein
MRSELVSTGLGFVMFAAGTLCAALPVPAKDTTRGTLHDVVPVTWLSASSEDQLATATDWALAFPSVQASVRAEQDPRALGRFAGAMRDCVSTSATDENTSGKTTLTSDIAAACAVTLRWVGGAKPPALARP